MPNLRLKAIHSLIPLSCGTLFDIGADHGLLAEMFLARQGTNAVVTDLSEKSLTKARELLGPMKERVRFFVADGLLFGHERPEGRAAYVISGMGGPLIARILDDGYKHKPEIFDNSCFILGPNTEPEAVRMWLTNHGMEIEAEACVKERSHYYQIISAVKSKHHKPLSREERLYGPRLLEQREPMLLELLEQRVKTLDRAIEKITTDTPSAQSAKEALEEEKTIALYCLARRKK